jgi:hypothetical protein
MIALFVCEIFGIALVAFVVNWLLTYQKILWTHIDPQGHVT